MDELAIVYISSALMAVIKSLCVLSCVFSVIQNISCSENRPKSSKDRNDSDYLLRISRNNPLYFQSWFTLDSENVKKKQKLQFVSGAPAISALKNKQHNFVLKNFVTRAYRNVKSNTEMNIFSCQSKSFDGVKKYLYAFDHYLAFYQCVSFVVHPPDKIFAIAIDVFTATFDAYFSNSFEFDQITWEAMLKLLNGTSGEAEFNQTAFCAGDDVYAKDCSERNLVFEDDIENSGSSFLTTIVLLGMWITIFAFFYIMKVSIWTKPQSNDKEGQTVSGL